MARRMLAVRTALFIALVLLWQPLRLSAQIRVVEPEGGLIFRSSEAPNGVTLGQLTTLPNGWRERTAAPGVHRLRLSAASAGSTSLILQQPQRKRSWIGRHPVLFGTLVGFGGGFLVGYLPGDDGVFYDFTAEFNGLVLGGVGAGAGALVGAVAGATTK